jgi:PAS domain S-box-containing protein
VKTLQNTSADHAADNFITLLNFIADPAIVIDEKANFLFMNNTFEKGTGYTSKDWVGKSVFTSDKLDPEGLVSLKKNFEKRIHGEQIPPYEISLRNYDNKKRIFELNAKRICFSSKTAILIIFRDVTNRKIVEKKLKRNSQKMAALVNAKVKEIEDNAEKMRSIFDSSPDAIIFIDSNGNLNDFNNSSLKLFGYTSKKEVKKLNIFDYVPLHEKRHVEVSLEKIAKTNLMKTQRFRLLQREGQEFPAEISAGAVRDAKGQLLGFVINIKDVSERKKLEDELIAGEARFRAMADSTNDAVVLLDEEDTISFWNRSAERMFGYTTQEVFGKKLSDMVVPPKGREGHRMLVKKLAQSEECPQGGFDITAVRKDKTSFPAELATSKLQLKGSRYVLGVIHDISNRKKVEETIKQERDMLEKVTENIGAGLAIISKDYKIIWANKLLRKDLEFSTQNQLCYTVFNHVKDVCQDCGVKKVFYNMEQVNRHDYKFIDSQGKQKVIELIVTPIKDINGNIIAALELAVDVTEKRKLESENSIKLEKLVEERTGQLREAQEKLVKTERLAAIGELAAMVGHDLRNPLTGMKAATYYLKGKTKCDPNTKTKEMLELIDTCIDQSNKIVNDLLEYSRTLKLELTQTAPATFIKGALSAIQAPQNIKLTHKVSGNTLVKFDAAKMQRVFLNIVKNAFDAMPKGGQLKIISRQTGKNWVISFADSGEGMSNETMKKLGNPLFTTKAKGMGFGIPICKRIVEAHGGKLLINSVQGKGTTITIKVPLNPNEDELQLGVLGDNFGAVILDEVKIR